MAIQDGSLFPDEEEARNAFHTIGQYYEGQATKACEHKDIWRVHAYCVKARQYHEAGMKIKKD
jgi:hypothetical protein